MNTFVINDKVGETLCITLYMKHLENQRKDSALRDPVASCLTRCLEYDFSKFDGAVSSQTGVVIRSKYFDDMARHFIDSHVDPVVVILGCGLDTRVHRLDDVAHKAHFYELDIPEVMQMRDHYIECAPNVLRIGCSMFDFSWAEIIRKQRPCSPLLIIIEDVIMYFEQPKIDAFFAQLADEFECAEVLFDIINTWMSKHSHLHETVKMARASFKSGVDKDDYFESLNKQLKLVNAVCYQDFKLWRRIGLKGWLTRLMPKLRNSNRMLHYRIG